MKENKSKNQKTKKEKEALRNLKNLNNPRLTSQAKIYCIYNFNMTNKFVYSCVKLHSMNPSVSNT